MNSSDIVLAKLLRRLGSSAYDDQRRAALWLQAHASELQNEPLPAESLAVQLLWLVMGGEAATAWAATVALRVLVSARPEAAAEVCSTGLNDHLAAQVLNSRSREMQRAAGQLLMELGCNSEQQFRNALRTVGVLPRLVQQFLSPAPAASPDVDGALAYNRIMREAGQASQLLARLAEDSEWDFAAGRMFANPADLVAAGSLPALVNFLPVSHLEADPVIRALTFLNRSSADLQRQLAEAGLIPALLGFLQRTGWLISHGAANDEIDLSSEPIAEQLGAAQAALALLDQLVSASSQNRQAAVVAGGVAILTSDASFCEQSVPGINPVRQAAHRLALQLQGVQRPSRQPAQAGAADSASTAAAAAAADAAMAALLAEEEQAAGQQAARVAARAAKQQRKKSARQQAAQQAPQRGEQAPQEATLHPGACDARPAAGAAAEAASAEFAAEPAAGAAAEAASAEFAAEPAGPAAEPGLSQHQPGTGTAKGSTVGKQKRKKKGKQSGQGAGGTASQPAVAAAGAGRQQQQDSSVDAAAANESEQLEALLRQLGVQDSAAEAVAPAETAAAAVAAHVAAAPATADVSASGGGSSSSGGSVGSSSAAARLLAAGIDAELLGELLCPITHEPMRDPVVAADGTTYERAAIEGWIARQQADGQAPCSPLTGAPLPHLMLTPNHALRKLVAGFAASGLLGN